MRPLLLLIFLTFILNIPSSKIHAQTFAPVGSYWCYHGSSDFFTPASVEMAKWTDTVRSEKDTVVAGINCRKISVHRRELQINSSDTFHTIANYYVYDNIDTAFVYSPTVQQFVPLYIFSAQEGDTICLPVPFPEFTDNITSYCFVISEVETELFDNVPLKSFYTRTLIAPADTTSVSLGLFEDYTAGRGNHGKYTERLGGTWDNVNGLFPTLSRHNPTFNEQRKRKEWGLPGGKLSRYSDAENSIILTQFSCDFIGQQSVGIETVASSHPIMIFPNPSPDYLTIRTAVNFSTPVNVTLTNITGKQVRELPLPAGKSEVTLYLKGLSQGIYFLRVSGGNFNYRQKVVVQYDR